MIPGVPRIINAYGTNTRLHLGLLAVNPIAFDDADAALLGACLRAAEETT